MITGVKSQNTLMLESIEDENVLNQVIKEVAFYTSKKDIAEHLDADQVNELDKTPQEADNKQTITWDDFKKEMYDYSGK